MLSLPTCPRHRVTGLATSSRPWWSIERTLVLAVDRILSTHTWTTKTATVIFVQDLQRRVCWGCWSFWKSALNQRAAVPRLGFANRKQTQIGAYGGPVASLNPWATCIGYIYYYNRYDCNHDVVSDVTSYDYLISLDSLLQTVRRPTCFAWPCRYIVQSLTSLSIRYPAAVKSNDNHNRDPDVFDGSKLGDSGRQDMWGCTSPAQLCNFEVSEISGQQLWLRCDEWSLARNWFIAIGSHGHSSRFLV